MSDSPLVLTERAQRTLDTRPREERIWSVVGFFVLLFIVEWYLYFWNHGHFFQADTVFLLYHRATTLPEFLREFTRLQLSGWYRPLSHQVFESVLYPFLGLNPVGYRIPVYGLFIANTVAVHALGIELLQRPLAAALGTFFFAIHTTNAFTTYDLGFTPELLYTFLYICAVLAYIRFARRGSRFCFALSIACFIGSLLSKEAAVTLPLVLFLTYLLFTPANGSSRNHLVGAMRSTFIYAVIAVAYLIFVLGHLHVQGFDIAKVFQKPETISGSSYHLVFDKTIVENADLAASWAFNMPRGWHGGFRHISPDLVTFLNFFRAIAVGLGICLLFTSRRNIFLYGTVWFLLTTLPALPLVNHFLPYYLFLPLVGFSLLIGSAFEWGAERLTRQHWMAAPLMITLLFGGLLVACTASIHADIENHRLLGGWADIASRSLAGLMRLYPELPPKATIYIDDREEPLAWDHSWGGLIKMAYDRDDITVLYSSAGDLLALGPEVSISEAIVLKYRAGSLRDDTEAFRNDPSRFVTRFKVSEIYALSLSPPRVRVGDSFSIVITRAHDVVVKIAYITDNGPTHVFDVYLDQQGRSTFNVSQTTPKGFYRFVGFNIAGQNEWIGSEATIIVE